METTLGDPTDLCDRCLHPRGIHPPTGGTWDGHCNGLTLYWPDDRCYCDEFVDVESEGKRQGGTP